MLVGIYEDSLKVERHEIHTAYIGLGSNLGDRAANIRRAALLMDGGGGSRLITLSDTYETDPVGYADQPMFLNAAMLISTAATPRALLDRLLAVERELGRTRDGPRFGPRIIDLDLLLYDDLVLDEPGLTIPHPRMHERRFVLEPLAEVGGPSLEIPGHGPIRDLLAGLD
jgi:2-amino-4-hydroxy-6-hydroxymethyldihydropteridine diphosphokinase